MTKFIGNSRIEMSTCGDIIQLVVYNIMKAGQGSYKNYLKQSDLEIE